MKLWNKYPIYCDIELIKPELIKKYLISHNWENTHTYPDGVTCWKKETSSNIGVIRHIPNQKMYSDYVFNLSCSLSIISETDEISLLDLIKKIDSSVEVRTQK